MDERTLPVTDEQAQESVPSPYMPEVYGEVTPVVAESAAEAERSTASADAGTGSDMLQPLVDELRGLRRDIETKFLYDDSKQRQLDTMHAELQAYRNGLHYQLLRPIFTDLIALHDGMKHVADRLAQARDETAAGAGKAAATEIEQFRTQIEEILTRNGVDVYVGEDATFDRERQRAISSVETQDPTLDKRIAEHLRPGFLYEGRIVVQAEQVRTYRFCPVDSGK